MDNPITPPPPHLLKKFSAQAQDETKKRNGAGYLKTFATFCIEWAMNCQSTSNDSQIRRSDIQPPTELVQQWIAEHFRNCGWVDASGDSSGIRRAIATQAARWGADQELEACCEWLARNYNYPQVNHPLRTARRPKPPSLKEQALALIDECTDPHGDYLDDNALATIRRALEALDD